MRRRTSSSRTRRSASWTSPTRMRTAGSSSKERSYATTSKPRVVPSTDAGGGTGRPRETAAAAAARASACLARPSSFSRTRRGPSSSRGGARPPSRRRRRGGGREVPRESRRDARVTEAILRRGRALRGPAESVAPRDPLAHRDAVAPAAASGRGPDRDSRSFVDRRERAVVEERDLRDRGGPAEDPRARRGRTGPGWRRFASSVATASTSASGAAASAGSSAPPRNDVVRIEPAGARPEKRDDG